MNNKCLFLVFHGLVGHSGITKKIRAQAKALTLGGVPTHIGCIDIDASGTSYFLVDDQQKYCYGKGLRSKLSKRYYYTPIGAYLLENDIQILYLRHYGNANPLLTQFIVNLRQMGVRVILEIPTYPYDSEFREASWTDRIKHTIDKFSRESLASQVEAIVTFSEDQQIFRQRTINISNGIDLSEIPLRTPIAKENNPIDLIHVSELHYWHGIDRLFHGLRKYYQSDESPREITLHIVGEPTTPHGKELKSLAHSLHLDDRIVFHGACYGERLNELFDTCDFAIGSLGRHRSHITRIKPLKNREYAGRGIPFIYSETDDDFDQQPYVLKAPADDSPIDVAEIVTFYEGLSMSPLQIRRSIEKTLTWEIQMKKVIDQLHLNK